MSSFIINLFCIHVFFYWLAVGFYTFFYNQWKNDSPKVIKQVLINQFVYTPLYIIPFQFYPTSLPTYNIIWQLPAIIFLTDIIFYICHRYFHYNKILYTLVHRKHHEYDPPIASAALYAHPIEHLFINISSTVFPMFIVKANLTVAIIWIIISSVNVVVAHIAIPNGQHTLHHRYLKCNYGVGMMLMDRIFNTLKI